MRNVLNSWWGALSAALLAVTIGGCDGRPVVGGSADAAVANDVAEDMTPVCTGARQACGSVCVDLQADDRNCGACGRSCAAGTRCEAGACRVVCPGGQVACASGGGGDAGGDAGGAVLCTLLDTDRANCGACGRTCASGQVCSSGMCTTTCSETFTTCGTGGARYCADTARSGELRRLRDRLRARAGVRGGRVHHDVSAGAVGVHRRQRPRLLRRPHG